MKNLFLFLLGTLVCSSAYQKNIKDYYALRCSPQKTTRYSLDVSPQREVFLSIYITRLPKIYRKHVAKQAREIDGMDLNQLSM